MPDDPSPPPDGATPGGCLIPLALLAYLWLLFDAFAQIAPRLT